MLRRKFNFLQKEVNNFKQCLRRQSLKRQFDLKGIASIALKSKTLAEKVWPEKAKSKKTMPEKVVTVQVSWMLDKEARNNQCVQLSLCYVQNNSTVCDAFKEFQTLTKTYKNLSELTKTFQNLRKLILYLT